MSNRLGRNPFEDKSKVVRLKTPLTAEIVDEAPKSKSKSKAKAKAAPKKNESLLGWALIDVPAETYVLGLKLIMLARNTWNGRRG